MGHTSSCGIALRQQVARLTFLHEAQSHVTAIESEAAAVGIQLGAAEVSQGLRIDGVRLDSVFCAARRYEAASLP